VVVTDIIASDGHDDLGVQVDLVLLGRVVPGKLVILVGGKDAYPEVSTPLRSGPKARGFRKKSAKQAKRLGRAD
jgi:hypothetical protein